MTEQKEIPNLNETTEMQGTYYKLNKDQTEVVFSLIDLSEKFVEKILDSRNPEQFKVYGPGDTLTQVDGVEVPFEIALKAAKSNKANFLAAFDSEDYPAKNVIRKDASVERRVIIGQVEYIMPFRITANKKLQERLSLYEEEGIDALSKTFKLTKDTKKPAAEMYDVKVLQVKPNASVQAVADSIVAPVKKAEEVVNAASKMEKDFVEAFENGKFKGEDGKPVLLNKPNLVDEFVKAGGDKSRGAELWTLLIEKQ